MAGASSRTSAITRSAVPGQLRHRLLDYRALLEVAGGEIGLGNPNLDLGRRSLAGDYRLADEAYSRLLDKLRRRRFAGVTPELREDILAFFADSAASIEIQRKDPARWRRNRRDLERLKTISP
jgi:hypothetical protein